MTGAPMAVIRASGAATVVMAGVRVEASPGGSAPTTSANAAPISSASASSKRQWGPRIMARPPNSPANKRAAVLARLGARGAFTDVRGPAIFPPTGAFFGRPGLRLTGSTSRLTACAWALTLLSDSSPGNGVSDGSAAASRGRTGELEMICWTLFSSGIPSAPAAALPLPALPVSAAAGA